MKILVTGGAGFVGRNICKYFANEGIDVVATYHNNKPDTEVANVKYVCVDLSKPIEIDDRFDAIVHTAVSKSGATLSMDEYVRGNIDTARNLIEYARNTKIATLIFFSTRNIYGEIRCDEVAEENDKINPDKYGQTKYIAEQLFCEAEGLNTLGIRTPGIIGKGAHDIWLVNTVRKMVNNEAITISDFDTKNLVDIEDISKFIKMMIEQSLAGNKFKYPIINLSMRDTINNREIIEIIKERTKSLSKVTVEEKTPGLFQLNSDKAYEMGYVSKKPKDIVNDYISSVIIS